MKLGSPARSLPRFVLTAAAVAAMAGLAVAEPPAALDRVPGDAAIVVTFRNIEQTQGKLMDMAKLVGAAEKMEAGPMAELDKIIKTPGLNKSGSLALAIMAGPDGVNFNEDQGPVVIIAPISDYAAFVKGMGGTAGEGVNEVKFDEETGYIKDIGGGFAALSPKKDMLTAFAGKGGNTAGHAKSMGKTGQGIADRADVLIITNIPALEKQLKEGVSQMQEQAKNATAMMGPQGAQAAAGIAMFQSVAENWARDAERAVVGLSKSDNGIAIDVASQFKDNSELSKFFQDSGKSGAMIGKVPNQPFLFAGAFDMSAPGIKMILKNVATMAEAQAKAAGNESQLPMAEIFKASDKTGGMAFVVGANPAAMMGGGLFTNTTTYIATSDPKGYITAMKDAMAAANGKKNGPVTTKSTYEPEAQEIKGIKADKWSNKMEVDPNDPMAMQVQMMTSMLFGPTGMGGYTASTGDAVVSVLSPNTPLMEMAIDAAKSGKGLGDEPSLKAVQAGLPANRTFELYIGSKSIFDSIGGIMAMMGGGAPFKAPDKLTPVAIAGTTEAGGVNFHIFVPGDVIQAVSELGQSMKHADDEEMDAPKDDNKSGKAPRF